MLIRKSDNIPTLKIESTSTHIHYTRTLSLNDSPILSLSHRSTLDGHRGPIGKIENQTMRMLPGNIWFLGSGPLLLVGFPALRPSAMLSTEPLVDDGRFYAA